MQKYEETLYTKKPRKRQAQEKLTKYDIIKKHHKFLRDSDSQEQSEKDENQVKQKHKKQQEVAKQYYDSLFKQYAIVDLSKYQHGQIGCRWRTEKQVIKNKGERICASTKCKEDATNTYEMNFMYFQEGEKKSALVKVSVCKPCAVKLNYSRNLKEIIKKPKLQE